MNAVYGLTWLLSYGGHGWGNDGGWPWLWGPLMLALWAGVAAAAAWLVVRMTRSRAPSATERAADVLAERYARGEITTEEYRERLQQLGNPA